MYKWAENVFIVVESGQFPTLSAGMGPSPLPLGYRSYFSCLPKYYYYYLYIAVFTVYSIQLHILILSRVFSAPGKILQI